MGSPLPVIPPPYSPWIGVKKALLTAVGAFGALALPAIWDWLSSDQNVAALIGHLNPKLIGLAVPVAALVRFWLNYRKQNS